MTSFHDPGYAHRVRICRACAELDIKVHVTISQLPIHCDEPFRSSCRSMQGLIDFDDLSHLLASRLSSKQLANEYMCEALSGRSVEFNLLPLAAQGLILRLQKKPDATGSKADLI
jgi:hypothetical protein